MKRLKVVSGFCIGVSSHHWDFRDMCNCVALHRKVLFNNFSTDLIYIQYAFVRLEEPKASSDLFHVKWDLERRFELTANFASM